MSVDTLTIKIKISEETKSLEINNGKPSILLCPNGFNFIGQFIKEFEDKFGKNGVVYNTLTEYHSINENDLLEMSELLDVFQEKGYTYDLQDVALVKVLNLYQFLYKNRNKRLFIVCPETGMHINDQEKFISRCVEFGIKDIIVFTHSPDIISNHQDIVVD